MDARFSASSLAVANQDPATTRQDSFDPEKLVLLSRSHGEHIFRLKSVLSDLCQNSEFTGDMAVKEIQS